MIIAITGFAAGLLHVLSGPDHLAAVASLSIEEKKSSYLIGLKWGLGHTAGVMLVGVIALLFREVLPMELISSYSERLVGVILIGIGVWGLHKVAAKQIHTHEHYHDGEKHAHLHFHKEIKEEHPKTHSHTHAAMGVGIIHGLAGSSHLLGVLPALALPTRTDAAVYLIFFGVGTILAMAGFSSALGLAANKITGFGLKLYNALLASLSIVAIGVGGVWLFI